MTHRSATTGIRPGLLHLDPTEPIDESSLRRFVECMRDVKPDIRQSIARHGHGMTLMALITIVADQAVESGVSALVAEVLRRNAEMLEADERLGATAGHA